MDKSTAEKVAKILLRIGAVSLNPQKPYKYSSGILSPVYTDCRLLISHPKERRIIRDLYIKRIKSVGKFDIIAGTATAGIPHAAWIAEKMNLPLIYVRGKAKDHGKGNSIEGSYKKEDKIAVIEDLISTGSSSIDCVLGIRNQKGKSSSIFSIITYGMKKAKDNFDNNKIKLYPLTDFETVVKIAAKYKYIKNKDIAIILEWIQDPPSWGKKMGFK